MGDAVVFPNVALLPLHCKNCEQVCGGGLLRIKYWVLRQLTIQFFCDEEKGAEQCQSKISDGKVGVNWKSVPYTYKNLLTVAHTSAPIRSEKFFNENWAHNICTLLLIDKYHH